MRPRKPHEPNSAGEDDILEAFRRVVGAAFARQTLGARRVIAVLASLGLAIFVLLGSTYPVASQNVAGKPAFSSISILTAAPQTSTPSVALAATISHACCGSAAAVHSSCASAFNLSATASLAQVYGRSETLKPGASLSSPQRALDGESPVPKAIV